MRAMKCRDRVLLALKHTELSPQELADSLFITRATVRTVLRELFSAGLVHRKFFHNARTNRPDYKYCCVAYPARPQRSAEDAARELVTRNIVADFDALHIRFRRIEA